MKNIFSKMVMIMVFAMFNAALLNNALAIEGQEAQLKLAAVKNLDNIGALVKAIEFSDRDEWQKPDEVVKSLNLKPGDVIADIGAGDGYFTKRFARAVSPGGQALGLEISSSKVEYMRKDAERSGLTSYKALLIDSDDPGLKPGSVDVVFMCNTYHHLSNRVKYLKRLSKSLKKNGRIVIVDFYKKPMPVGPSSPDHKLAREVVLEEFQEAGYKFLDDKDFLPHQYYLEFGF
jgi:ubiquinone/menaquinone biosynthesis C-methylase UbiE